MNYVSVDLCGPSPMLVEAVFEPGGELSPLRVRRTRSLAALADADGPDGASFWTQLGQALSLGPAAQGNPPGESGGGARQIEPLMQSHRATLAEAIGATAEEETQTAVVYPYRTPPVLRRHLTPLFGRTTLPVGGGGALSRLVGLEAPVALVVEALGRGLLTLPARLLAVTGAGAARELSVVHAEIDPVGDPDRRAVRVSVRACLGADTGAEVASALEWLRRSRTLPSRGADWRLVANGPASDVADALGIDPSLRVELSGGEESPLALGAVRFAGLRPSVDQPMLGTTAEAVWSEGVCPSPVGLVGVNRDGRRYWSRLFEAGAELPTTHEALVHSRGEGPRYRDEILMAECVHPAFWHHAWIAQDDWRAAGLRIHELARATLRRINRSTLDPNLHSWSFTLKQRDRQEPWGAPRWSIYYQRPTSA